MMGQCRKAVAKLIFFCALASSLRPSSAYLGTTTPLRIDCGSTSPQEIDGIQWQKDDFYTSGDRHSIAHPNSTDLDSAEVTLRSFPGNQQSCYYLAVPPGRYLIRLGFAYYNYDGLNRPPYFDVLVQNTLVETVDAGFEEEAVYYSGYVTFALDGKVSICFVGRIVGTVGEPRNPFVNTIEVLPVDTDAYEAGTTGQHVILSSFLRVNFGGPEVGPEPEDPGFRTWTADELPEDGNYSVVKATGTFNGVGIAPYYLPESIFQTARTPLASTRKMMVELPGLMPTVDKDSWLLLLYFAEPDPTTKKGERVFDVMLGDGSGYLTYLGGWQGFDILNRTKNQNALVVPVFFNYEDYVVSEGQKIVFGIGNRGTSELPAIINAAELFEVIRVTQAGSTYSQEPKKESGLSGGTTAAIILGCLLVIVLLAFIIYVKKQRKTNAYTFADHI